jgi:hypothetical protein
MKYSIPFGAAVTIVVVAILISFLLSWPVMMLWNEAFVGAITGINQITWLQAWGINILSAILFKTTINKS